MNRLFDELYRIILLDNADQKCLATHNLATHLAEFSIDHSCSVKPIQQPGYPNNLQLVAPKHLKKRGIQQQAGRNSLMHAIAHIEFNAINLALDAAYRFRNQPTAYYHDWIKVADDEARHFTLIRNYLNKHDCDYADFPAHNGLWEMAVQTQHDVIARMALVPRVLEARGLDVTPGIIKRLNSIGDNHAVDILTTIYHDEIEHVNTGSFWFKHQCQQHQLNPRDTFLNMVDCHLHGELKGPFNLKARLAAGFDEAEMTTLEGC